MPLIGLLMLLQQVVQATQSAGDAFAHSPGGFMAGAGFMLAGAGGAVRLMLPLFKGGASQGGTPAPGVAELLIRQEYQREQLKRLVEIADQGLTFQGQMVTLMESMNERLEERSQRRSGGHTT